MDRTIGNPERQHRYIIKLKAEKGDFRPLGMTLSLINATSPDTYWSHWCILWNKPYRRRLSMNPDDYGWESNADNLRRNKEDNESYVASGLLVIASGVGPQWMRRIYKGPIETISIEEWLARGKSPLKAELLEEWRSWNDT